jgi:hypothetical protein
MAVGMGMGMGLGAGMGAGKRAGMEISNRELEARFAYLVKTERKITREILELLCEIEERKFYLEQAYPSLFEWLVKKWGYSQPAAYRRIQAARLMKHAPEIKLKLVTGELNLSTVAQVQTVIRREERRTREKISPEVKREIVSAVEGKSCEEADRFLQTRFPVAVLKREQFRPLGSEHQRLTIVLEEKEAESLVRAKQLLSHSCQTWAEVVAWLVRDYLKRKDPMLRK